MSAEHVALPGLNVICPKHKDCITLVPPEPGMPADGSPVPAWGIKDPVTGQEIQGKFLHMTLEKAAYLYIPVIGALMYGVPDGFSGLVVDCAVLDIAEQVVQRTMHKVRAYSGPRLEGGQGELVHNMMVETLREMRNEVNVRRAAQALMGRHTP